MRESVREIDVALKDRLRELRLGGELTQEQLAHAAGLTLTSVRKVESGEVTDPRWSTMRALARALRASLDDLAAADERPPEPPRPMGRPKKRR